MKVLVIGDSCIDVYIYGDCNRLSPEGPVPVLNEVYRQSARGMAGNTYNNMKAFCSNVDLISNDSEQIIKTRFVDNKTNQLLLRVDTNDQCDLISADDLLIPTGQYDLTVVSDYCKGFLDDSDLINIGSNCDLSVLDTKRELTQDIINSYSFIKLDEQVYRKNLKILGKLSNMRKAVITKGERGVRFLDHDYSPSQVLQTFDVSGAGDVFTAAFSYRLMCGHRAENAIRFAQDCCVKVIQRRGTCIYDKDME